MALNPTYCSAHTAATTFSINGIKAFLLEEVLMTEKAEDL